MATFAELIARIETAAQGRNADPHQSPVIDGAAMTAESIFPNALRYAVRQMLARGENAQNLARDHTINLTDGVGDLPDEVLREYLRSHSMLPAHPFASWLDYADFSRARLSNLLEYYSASNGQFYFLPVGGDADTGNSTVVLNCPGIPAIPADATDEITDCSPRLADAVVSVCVSVLTGELPFSALEL